MFANRRLTEDGLECTFALNHMAYFVITEGLRERLLASALARIVSTASAAHQGARLDFDDLQLAKSFGPMKAYGRSKLCNILRTRREVAEDLGVGLSTLGRWISRSQDRALEAPDPPPPHEDINAELKRLRRENEIQ